MIFWEMEINKKGRNSVFEVFKRSYMPALDDKLSYYAEDR